MSLESMLKAHAETMEKLIASNEALVAAIQAGGVSAKAEPAVKDKTASKSKDAKKTESFAGLAYLLDEGTGTYVKAVTAEARDKYLDGGYTELPKSRWGEAQRAIDQGVLGETDAETPSEPEVRYFHKESTDRLYRAVVGENDAEIAKLTKAKGVEEITAEQYEAIKDRQARFKEELAKSEAKRKEQEREADGLTDEPEVSREDAKKKLVEVKNKVGKKDLLDLFKKYGAKNFHDVKDEDLGKIHADAVKLLEAQDDEDI